MKILKGLRLTLLAVLSLLLVVGVAALGGCGADKTADKPAANANPALANTVAGDGKTLTVAADATFAPMEYMKEDGTMTGFDVDLMKAIGDKMGAEVKFENIAWDALIAAVQTNSGQVDFAISSMTITPEREKNILFSQPYFVSVQALAVPKGSPLTTVDDLKKGDRVAVQNATTGHIWADANLAPKGIEVKPYAGGQECFTAMASGEVQAIVIDLAVAANYTNQPSYNAETKGAIASAEKENYGIAFPKGSTALCDAVNKALQEVIDDGTYDKLYAQYIDDQNPPVMPEK